MRLRDIAELLRTTLPTFAFHSAGQTGNNWYVTGYRAAVLSARKLNDAGVLVKDTSRMLSITEIAQHVENEITVSANAYNSFNGAMQRVRQRGEILLETLDEMLEGEAAEQIAIRLPDETDLSDVGELLQLLEKLLNQVVVNEYVKGEVRLISFDRGSNWLELYLGTIAAVSAVGAIVRLIYQMGVKALDLASRREVFRSLKLETDLAAAAERALEAEFAATFEAGALHVVKVAGAPEADNDFRERIKYVVDTLTPLVNRGLLIRASLTAPPETQAEFPEPRLIAEAIKELGTPKKQLE
jgi:hypothetical protein